MVFVLTPEICLQLVSMHMNVARKTPFELEEMLVSQIGLVPSEYDDREQNTLALLYENQEDAKSILIKQSLPHIYAVVLILILEYVDKTLCADHEDEIVESLFADSQKNWIFDLAKKYGPSHIIVEAIANRGVLHAETQWCFLVREFARIHGVIGLEYFLSKCLPLNEIYRGKAVTVALLLQAINMALEILGLVQNQMFALTTTLLLQGVSLGTRS
jgi:hypothetical protein